MSEIKIRTGYSEYADVTAVAAQVPDGCGGRFAVGFNVMGKPAASVLEQIAQEIADGRAFELHGKIDGPVMSWSRVRLAR